MRSDDEVIAEFRKNTGHVGGELSQTPIVLIHHIGPRSGTTQVTPLAYQSVRGGTFTVRAEELEDAARAEIWLTLVAGAPMLGEYQATTTRRFPVFLLTPEPEAPTT